MCGCRDVEVCRCEDVDVEMCRYGYVDVEMWMGRCGGVDV